MHAFFHIATWNTRGGFGPEAANHPGKLAKIHFLLTHNEVNCFQETHGNLNDIDAYLRRFFRTTHVWYISTLRRDAGGCLIAVKFTYLEPGTALESKFQIVKGRIIGCDFNSKAGPLRILCLHLVPGLAIADIRRQILGIRERICDFEQRCVLLCGDMNFAPPNEGSLDINSNVVKPRPTSVVNLWDRLLGDRVTEFF